MSKDTHKTFDDKAGTFADKSHAFTQTGDPDKIYAGVVKTSDSSNGDYVTGTESIDSYTIDRLSRTMLIINTDKGTRVYILEITEDVSLATESWIRYLEYEGEIVKGHATVPLNILFTELSKLL